MRDFDFKDISFELYSQLSIKRKIAPLSAKSIGAIF